MSTDALPAWDIQSEYPSISSVEFQKDESEALQIIASIDEATKKIRASLTTANPDIVGVQKILENELQSFTLLYNLRTYCECQCSTDGKNTEARGKASQISKHLTKLVIATKPTHLFMSKCDQAVCDKILSTEKLKGSAYHWKKEREEQASLLSEKEEVLISDLNPSGMKAWGDLYNNITGTLNVKLELNGKTEMVGLAHAAGLAKGPDEPTRKAAWQGVQQAWRDNQEAAAAILNSLAGWRLTEIKHRSHTQKRDYLTEPLNRARIEPETLTAMMTALKNSRASIQKGVKMQARMMNKNRLDPWDLLAPAPLKSTSYIPYNQAIASIRESFSKVDKNFGEFVTTMDRNRWIDAQVSPNRRTGGYCTGFVKSQTPRIFMTYLGSSADIGTLAHEIGHAFHHWVMRDLSLHEQDYPMTLAETASIFAETVFADEMTKKAQSAEDRLTIAWGEMERAQAFLLNIPARFDFEVSLYENRKEKTLSAEELIKLTQQAWETWYGDSLSSYDDMFWATKMHFSISGISFYNFPYTFGYLFSLSIYARRQELGDKFMEKYIDLLRDTGRMNAEEVVMKHLGEDIRKPEFWQKAIDVVKGKVENFITLSGSGSA